MKLQFARFVIPSILSMWVYSIYTIVDGFFVAKFINEQALASVNLSMPFVNGLLALAILFAVGSQTTLGILIGKGDHQKANRLFTFINVSLLVFSVTLSLLCYICSSSIARFLGADQHTISYMLSYLRIIILFAPCFIFAYHFEVLIKIDGFPTLTILCSLTSAILNIFLDYVFIALFSFGIQGAAIATGIAQMMSALIYLFHFLKKKGNLRFVPFTCHFSIYKKIIRLSFGDFLSELSGGIVIYLYNFFLLRKLGFQSIVTFTIINYLSLIVTVTMQGISQGIQPLVSFHYGKNDGKQKIFLRYAFFTSFITAVIFFVFGNVFTEEFFRLFLGDEKMTMEISAFHQFSFYYLIVGFNIIAIGYFAAIGKPKYAIGISSLRGIFVIAIVLFLLPKKYLWFSSFLTEIIVGIVTWNFFHQIKKHSSTNEC